MECKALMSLYKGLSIIKLEPDIIPMTDPDPNRGYIAFDVHSVSA